MTKYRISVSSIVEIDDVRKAHDIGKHLVEITDGILEFHAGQDYITSRYGITEAEGEAIFSTVVSEYGNTLAVNVTKHTRHLDIKKGDKVAVTVRRVKE